MVDVALSVIAFIVAIGVLVSVHEYGHFIVARKLGFKVLRFSVGFGRPLWRWQGGAPDHVEYWLSSVPLGGYVKLLDEREGPVDETERHRAFNRRPIPHRIAVLAAGPGFNFLFAIFAYWVMFVSGIPALKPVVGAVSEGSVAAVAGLRADDEIRAVGGKPTATWEQAVIAILDELLADGRIELDVSDAAGTERFVELDVRDRVSELTEPEALFSGLGIRPGPTMPPDIERVDPDSPAERAGLMAGDRVLSVDGEPIESWQVWLETIRARPGETVSLLVLRENREVELAMRVDAGESVGQVVARSPSSLPDDVVERIVDDERYGVVELSMLIGEVEENGERVGRIGAWRPSQLPDDVLERVWSEERYGVVEGLYRGAAKTWEMTALTVRMLVRMVIGDVSLRNVSGPISIAAYAGDSAEAGFTSFLAFLSIVSISLGIMNLLPIPLLDGGQIVYQLAEWLKGSPLSERAMLVGQQLGIVFLIVLMSFVFYNDISRMFS